MQIPFNKPHLTGNETRNFKKVLQAGRFAGNGEFTQRCHQYFAERYGFCKNLLTTSCTDALEMAAILTNIQPGDEVIMPSFTFVSTANAFALRGAKIVFADSHFDQPNLDETKIEALISPKTRALMVMHYAGMACNMGEILKIAARHNLFVIEDAAQAIDGFYLTADNPQEPKPKTQNSKLPLGSLGHLAAFSFHETKNIHSGEGGLLVVNDENLAKRAEIIWEKGTNRSAFFRGEVEKYGWVDLGSSFLPNEMTAAFLLAQLEKLPEIQRRRIEIWEKYHEVLAELELAGNLRRPSIPDYASKNGHLYYMVLENLKTRERLIEHLKKQGIGSAFHYQSLHRSEFFRGKHDGRELPNADRFSDCLLRLPLYFDLTEVEQLAVIQGVRSFFGR